LAAGQAIRQSPDQQLIERFVEQREEAAFAALVERHGPMVLRVCRSVLRDAHAAEDAFQATFLVLVRKAASIGRRELLGNWLYGVAYRVAARARVKAARRHGGESQAVAGASTGPLEELHGRELCAILDEELFRLPERYRSPFLLCYVEGQTRDQAARQLGWSLRTLARRLEQGRKLLQSRLTRRGVTLSATLLVAELSHRSAAALPALLTLTTVSAASTFARGGAEIAGVSAQAVALTEGAIWGMTAAKWKVVALLLLAFALFTAGTGLVAHQVLNGPPRQDPGQPAKDTEQPKEEAQQIGLDRQGDPLPAGAVARLGTIRWRLDPELAEEMVVTSDGKTLVSVNVVTGISVWDMATGKLLRRIPEKLEPPQNGINPFSFLTIAADGRTAAFCKHDRIVHLIDIAKGEEKKSWNLPVGVLIDWFQGAALSADGQKLVTRNVDKTIRLWDTDSGKELLQIPVHMREQASFDKPRELAIAPDGRTLAWVDDSNDHLIHVCAADTGAELHALAKNEGDRRQIMFSPDGQKLAATDSKGHIQLWDLKTGQLVHAWASKHEGTSLPAAVFAPDSKSLFARIGSDALLRFDAATGQEVWRVPQPTSSSVQAVLAVTPDGATLIMCSAANSVLHRYDTATGKRALAPGELGDSLRKVVFSPDERRLHSLSEDGVLRTWEVATGKEVCHADVGGSWGKFSPDARWLALPKKDVIRLCDCDTGNEVRQLAGAPGQEVHALAFSQDGRMLAANWSDHRIVLWDTSTWKELQQITNRNDSVQDIAFTPNSKVLMGYTMWIDSQRKPVLYSWDVATGKERLPQPLPEYSSSPRFSSDGKMLFASPSDRVGLECWELATGQKRLEIKPARHIWPPIFELSPDERILLIETPDCRLTIYDAFTGQLLLSREANRGALGCYVFSPSGRRLVTTCNDATALIWDTAALLRPESPAPKQLEQTEFTDRWTDLFRTDAARAYQAIGKLAAVPEQTAPWLASHLQAAPVVEAKRLEQLVSDLDSDRFEVRDEAARALANYADQARPALEKVLAGKPSAEVRRSAEELVAQCDLRQPSELLRSLRAIEILERIGNDEAKAVLRTLSEGAAAARVTQEAKATLERLAVRRLDR
jgi:RNA polymerase sigma factor (sigma-70 family)